jgi:hypothetical protein
MKAVTFCRSCKGRGEVHPTSRYATNPPRMSGEIRDYVTSVCESCEGTGMTRNAIKLYCPANCECVDCRRLTA